MRRRSYEILLLLCSIAALYPPIGRAEFDPLAVQSRVCTGFTPEEGRWGPMLVDDNHRENACPDGYAIMGYGHVAGRGITRAEQFSISGYCCPLPEGVLTNERVLASEVCPEGFLVTGGKLLSAPQEPDRKQNIYRLVCTKIDTARFELGATTRGWSVGWGREITADLLRRLFGETIEQTTWSRIPLGLRYGILRTGPTEWADGGCIGYPWGALLVGRLGGACGDLVFREITLRTSVSDDTTRSQSDRFPVYPDCQELDDPYAPAAVCKDLGD